MKKKRGDDDGNFQLSPGGQAAFGKVNGQEQQQELSGHQHGEPNPVGPIGVNLQRCFESGAVIFRSPMGEGDEGDGEGEHEQSQCIEENREDGPAFHNSDGFDFNTKAPDKAHDFFLKSVFAACQDFSSPAKFGRKFQINAGQEDYE
jgi:hypothetical protein